jgi:uncharacterized protein (DUF433 family)
LFENLEEGANVEDFLKWFPGVTREQALAVLAHAEQSLARGVGRAGQAPSLALPAVAL